MKTTLKSSFALLFMVTIFASCELTRPIAATSNEIGKKVGKSTAIGLLYFPPFIGNGDASIQKAAQNGGIKKISTVDYKCQWFVFYSEWTTTVTGE
jgi:hypothetical protein